MEALKIVGNFDFTNHKSIEKCPTASSLDFTDPIDCATCQYFKSYDNGRDFYSASANAVMCDHPDFKEKKLRKLRIYEKDIKNKFVLCPINSEEIFLSCCAKCPNFKSNNNDFVDCDYKKEVK